MSNFKNWLNSTKKGLTDQVKKFKNKDFMDAIVAGCALVAFADGKIDAAEKNKMAGYMNLSEELKVFDMTQVIAQFNHYVSNFEFSPEIGKQEALNRSRSSAANQKLAVLSLAYAVRLVLRTEILMTKRKRSSAIFAARLI